jgi:hypothetical protein
MVAYNVPDPCWLSLQTFPFGLLWDSHIAETRVRHLARALSALHQDRQVLAVHGERLQLQLLAWRARGRGAPRGGAMRRHRLRPCPPPLGRPSLRGPRAVLWYTRRGEQRRAGKNRSLLDRDSTLFASVWAESQQDRSHDQKPLPAPSLKQAIARDHDSSRAHVHTTRLVVYVDVVALARASVLFCLSP